MTELERLQLLADCNWFGNRIEDHWRLPQSERLSALPNSRTKGLLLIRSWLGILFSLHPINIVFDSAIKRL